LVKTLRRGKFVTTRNENKRTSGEKVGVRSRVSIF